MTKLMRASMSLLIWKSNVHGDTAIAGRLSKDDLFVLTGGVTHEPDYDALQVLAPQFGLGWVLVHKGDTAARRWRDA